MITSLMTVAKAESLFDDSDEETKIKHKGLKGSNTPKESQDFVQGLGDAVDSGPDGGNVPSGGGYGEGGGGVGASMKHIESAALKRLEVAATKLDPKLRADLVSLARYDGFRIAINGKVVWSGLGNRAGLHDYARTVLSDKWDKSGKGFEKKLEALKKGDVVELYMYQSITRDRGRWQRNRKITLEGFHFGEKKKLVAGEWRIAQIPDKYKIEPAGFNRRNQEYSLLWFFPKGKDYPTFLYEPSYGGDGLREIVKRGKVLDISIDAWATKDSVFYKFAIDRPDLDLVRQAAGAEGLT